MVRGRDVVEVLRRRLVEPRVAESEVEDVLERRRFDARSLASSIFSRAVRVVLELVRPLALLSRCWDEGRVFEAAVMESRSLWNLRFDVAIASGIIVVVGLLELVLRLSGNESLSRRRLRSTVMICCESCLF